MTAIKIVIKWKTILAATLLMGPGFLKTCEAQQKFEKSVFYNVMASGDLDAVNNEINIVQDEQTSHKEGYEGALLMKKAGLLAKPKLRLKFFKEGRIKLETALLADNENTEFHFLRLAIEEHAPKIVKYHADIESDKLIIQKNFKGLSPVVQHAILDYCKNSKVLHAANF
ncbi:hypothetical protein [Mucilaginibacter gotjawali]|nr:hypothetical protein [Mucilaginibacter gotjawali]MBB3054050.1 hypothetical protein [Mucilaginibacter gotjawali]